MELVDKLNNKRQSLNKTAERSEKIEGDIVNLYILG